MPFQASSSESLKSSRVCKYGSSIATPARRNRRKPLERRQNVVDARSYNRMVLQACRNHREKKKSTRLVVYSEMTRFNPSASTTRKNECSIRVEIWIAVQYPLRVPFYIVPRIFFLNREKKRRIII